VHWTLNGRWIPPEPSKLPSIIIEQIPDLQYWSGESLETFHLGLLQLMIDMAKSIDDEKRRLTFFIRRTERKIKIIERLAKSPATQTIALRRIYDLLLWCEGHSPLPGFGMSNRFGNSLFIDPERQSIRV